MMLKCVSSFSGGFMNEFECMTLHNFFVNCEARYNYDAFIIYFDIIDSTCRIIVKPIKNFCYINCCLLEPIIILPKIRLIILQCHELWIISIAIQSTLLNKVYYIECNK